MDFYIWDLIVKSLIISYNGSLEVSLSEMMKSKCNVGLTVLSFLF